jgi:hypothetical protein
LAPSKKADAQDLATVKAVLKQVVPEHPELQIVDIQDIRKFGNDPTPEVAHIGSAGQAFIFGEFNGSANQELAICAHGSSNKPFINDKTMSKEERDRSFRHTYIVIAKKSPSGKWWREFLYKSENGFMLSKVPFILWDTKNHKLNYGELVEDEDEGSIKWDNSTQKYKYIPSLDSKVNDD